MAKIDGCYPNTNVLINKFEIKDEDTLKDIEANITSTETLKALTKKGIEGKLDYEHLKKIHKTLFSKIYSWAGKERSVNIAKGFSFCDVGMLPDFSNDIFSKLKRENFYLDNNKTDTITKIADLYGDLNCLHPFREGNGRSNKLFCQYIAGINGIQFDFSKIDKNEWNQASIYSAYGSNNMLNDILQNISEDITLEQTNFFRKSCSIPILEMENNKNSIIDEVDKTFDDMKLNQTIKENNTQIEFTPRPNTTPKADMDKGLKK